MDECSQPDPSDDPAFTKPPRQSGWNAWKRLYPEKVRDGNRTRAARWRSKNRQAYNRKMREYRALKRQLASSARDDDQI